MQKRKTAIITLALLPLWTMAQTVTSPNGNVSVKFSLSDSGQPIYEMLYKGKTVCKPSHLGLELAKDKHASKGMDKLRRDVAPCMGRNGYHTQQL